MCIDFVLIKIDCDQDETIKVDTTVLNSIMNSIEQSATNKDKTIVKQNAIITIKNTETGSIRCNPLILSNNLTQQTIIVDKFDNEQITQITNKIVDNIKSELSQAQLSGLGAFLTTAGSQKEGADVTTTIKNAVKNSVNESIINDAWTSDSTTETIDLINAGVIESKDSCQFLNSDLLHVRVINVAKNLQTSFQNNEVLNQVLTYAKQNQTTSSLSPLVKALIIGAIIIVVLLIIGGIIMAVVVK